MRIEKYNLLRFQAAINESGLGVLSWWDQQQQEGDDAADDEDNNDYENDENGEGAYEE